MDDTPRKRRRRYKPKPTTGLHQSVIDSLKNPNDSIQGLCLTLFLSAVIQNDEKFLASDFAKDIEGGYDVNAESMRKAWEKSGKPDLRKRRISTKEPVEKPLREKRKRATVVDCEGVIVCGEKHFSNGKCKRCYTRYYMRKKRLENKKYGR